ncbi:MAG: chain length determinant protein tyrosine kinase EpsG [Steroidobacteraceae bacterium]
MKATADQDNVIPVSPGITPQVRNERSIGTILIHAGRLTLENAERILHLQREKGIRFGDAAIQLGLLTQADVDFALARQFDYSYLVRGESAVSESIVNAYAPFSPQGQTFSALRGELMLRWFDNEPARKALAIISAEHGDGRSFITANLAVSFSQLGQKTLLIDADMRNPCQHCLFGIDNRNGLTSALASRQSIESLIHQIPGLLGLSVLPAGAMPPNPLELLARPLFPQLLAELSQQYDVILLDTPATSEFADAQAIAVRAGAALIVARKNATRIWRVRGISDTVSHASATVIGAVLNDFDGREEKNNRRSAT